MKQSNHYSFFTPERFMSSKKTKLNETSEFPIRQAQEADLPILRDFMTQSFSEMTIPANVAENLIPPGATEEMLKLKMNGYLDEVLKGDLESGTAFDAKYRAPNVFYVVYDAKDDKQEPLGCVGGVRKNCFDFELVRLFVGPKLRRKGMGKVLVNHIISFARTKGYERVFLYCGSKSGQALYRSVGFVSSNQGVPYFQYPVQARKPLRRVGVLGGVHGNELAGIHIVNYFLSSESTYSFKLEPILANPLAAQRCVRFVDRDLNRCFELKDLTTPYVEVASWENVRARELNQILGPKEDIEDGICVWQEKHPDRMDYLLDLHNTTSNMGVTLICLPGDVFTLRLAHHLAQKKDQLFGRIPFHLLVDGTIDRLTYNNIDSVPPSALCFEAGPLPHGTLNNPDVLRAVHQAVKCSLEFIDDFNQQRNQAFAKGQMEVVEGFALWKPVLFPSDDDKTEALRPSTRYILSEQLLGRDFHVINKGDAMFVDVVTGKVTHQYEEDEPAYACFIGEAAYYPAKVAFWLCKKQTFDVFM